MLLKFNITLLYLKKNVQKFINIKRSTLLIQHYVYKRN